MNAFYSLIKMTEYSLSPTDEMIIIWSSNAKGKGHIRPLR